MFEKARPIPLMLVFAALVAGCPDQNAGPATAGSSAPAASASAVTTAPAIPELPTPEPLDVERLEKALTCSAGSEGGPCRVLAGFKECKAHRLLTPSGDGRWIGTSYQVKDRAFTEDVVLVRSRRVPLTEVGKSQLTVKIGLVKLPDDEALRRHAEKAISAASRGDVPKVNNNAVAYLKGLKEWPESYAMEAKANQVFVVDRDGYYLCTAGDQRLLLVQPSSSAPGTADGQYAELWPVSW